MPLPNIYQRNIDLRNYVNFESSSQKGELEMPSNVRKIISVVGFRRVGKTYLLLDLAKKVGQDKCIYINFEDERIPKDVSTLTNLLDVLAELSGSKSYYLLLDEIQNIPNWSQWARRVVETTTHSLIISGSSSKLASVELPTELRGRSVNVKVNPLNFKEFLTFKKVDRSLLTPAQLLYLQMEFVRFGGFPEVVLSDEGKKLLLVDEYFNTFLQRDVIERHKLRRADSLSLLIGFLLNSKEYTVRRLANTISSLDRKIGKYTVSRYLSYLEESFFSRSLFIHTRNIKNRLQAPKKVYFVDSSFVSRKSTDFSNNVGKLMEQKVSEKIFADIDRSQSFNVFYWRNYRGDEVDLVLRKGEDVKKLIQVCYVSDVKNLPERETKGLILAAKELSCSNLEVVTWDVESTLSVNGYKINLIPLHKYLLEKHDL